MNKEEHQGSASQIKESICAVQRALGEVERTPIDVSMAKPGTHEFNVLYAQLVQAQATYKQVFEQNEAAIFRGYTNTLKE